MTTAIAKADEFPPDRVELLRRSICTGFTDDEMALFVAQCVRTGLDPFSRQIHATKRRDKRAGVDRLSIQTGIDGFRLIAQRTGELDGQDGPFWCGPEGIWIDVWLHHKPPAAAKVIVYRKGCSHGFTGIARFEEYAQRFPDGNLSGLWPKMPATMIAKCAEALALRKAFPQDLSGLYTPEEMEQSETPEPVQASVVSSKAVPPKAKEDGLPELEWLLTEYGRHHDCDEDAVLQKLCAAAGWVGIGSIDDLSPERVRVACESLRKKLNGKPPAGVVKAAKAAGMID